MLGMPRKPLISAVTDPDHPTALDPHSNIGSSIETSSSPILYDADVDSNRFCHAPDDPRGTEYNLSDRSLICGIANPKGSEVSKNEIQEFFFS